MFGFRGSTISEGGLLPDPPTENGDYALRVEDDGDTLSWVRSPNFLSLTAHDYGIRDDAETTYPLAALDDTGTPAAIVFGNVEGEGSLDNSFPNGTTAIEYRLVTDDVHGPINIRRSVSDPSALSIDAAVRATDYMQADTMFAIGPFDSGGGFFAIDPLSGDHHQVAAFDPVDEALYFGDVNTDARINGRNQLVVTNDLGMVEWHNASDGSSTQVTVNDDPDWGDVLGFGTFSAQAWLTANITVFPYNGAPEGVITGNPGAVIMDRANGDLYVKGSSDPGGNTGWKLVTAV